MNFNYKNPISPLSVLGNLSVSRSDVFGTNFSVLSTGGYMEVYSLSDLLFTIPTGITGLVEYSGNTIPIQFNKGTGSVFSPDVLTLNSDNISSGRRKIGMLVYVIEEDQLYQYQIPNFESLWSGATGATGPGGNTVIFSDFGTTVKSNSPEGIAFISAWTSNLIEGVGSGNSINSAWKKFVTGSDFTGGTVTGNTIFTNGLTANTFSASTYLGLPIDVFVTGGTFSGGSIIFTNNTGGTFNVSGISSFDTSVTGFTYNNNTLTILQNSGSPLSVTINTFTGLTANTISATTYLGLPIDPDTFVTGFTSSGTALTILQNEGKSPISTTIPTLPLSGALSSVTFNIVTSGGISATTISATTYQNLPIDSDRFVTGFTYNNNTFTLSDNSGSTFNATINTMTGLTVNGGLTVSGNSQLNGGISSTSFTGSTDRIVQVNSGGTFTATTDIISAYISSGSTAATLLSNPSNWDINGNYTGIAISGTFQGQKWYDGNYFYEAIQDNVFIRLIRG